MKTGEKKEKRHPLGGAFATYIHMCTRGVMLKNILRSTYIPAVCTHPPGRAIPKNPGRKGPSLWWARDAYGRTQTTLSLAEHSTRILLYDNLLHAKLTRRSRLANHWHCTYEYQYLHNLAPTPTPNTSNHYRYCCVQQAVLQTSMHTTTCGGAACAGRAKKWSQRLLVG